ncbi:Type IV pilus assembly PilZ domain protein [Candidatus Omnitrophus magneticus]|uniref:Type IV pilus assembly PilZ domain protein n=1 Tax=Candidatus Omnitrophus magneticus TaxID=1609969 RepID=A0A0F0CP41_9BACT|nr:Type IV pilus assembly PilZ domain protein [Candidatus Omnitrophus magneticus]
MCPELSDDNREFLRIDYSTILNYKTVKADKISNRKEILIKNISANGLLFRTPNLPPALSSVVWVDLDEKMRNICSEIEEDLIIHNGAVLGKVVRLAEGEPGKSYDVGVCFLRKKDITQEEIQEFFVEEKEAKQKR